MHHASVVRVEEPICAFFCKSPTSRGDIPVPSVVEGIQSLAQRVAVPVPPVITHDGNVASARASCGVHLTCAGSISSASARAGVEECFRNVRVRNGARRSLRQTKSFSFVCVRKHLDFEIEFCPALHSRNWLHTPCCLTSCFIVGQRSPWHVGLFGLPPWQCGQSLLQSIPSSGRPQFSSVCHCFIMGSLGLWPLGSNGLWSCVR